MFKKIYILWLRQLKRYWRSKPRMIGSLGQPILFLVALGYGMGSVFQKAGQGNYLDFLAPGIIGMAIIFTAIFSGIEIIWDRQFGYLKEVMVAPMSRLEIMVGRTIGGATVAFFAGRGHFGDFVVRGIPSAINGNYSRVRGDVFGGAFVHGARDRDRVPAQRYARIPADNEFFGNAIVFPFRGVVPVTRRAANSFGHCRG